ncbi:MAG: cupin, partial [Proteobacteria bacterium]|nr:cupin [Pseudomonadota bacterium]
MKTGNILANLPAHLEAEQFTDLLQTETLTITRIVSTGQSTDWQEAEEDEWVIVIKGAAILRFVPGDEALAIGPGGWCHIPALSRHRVEEACT